jgi:hypothetical protein
MTEQVGDLGLPPLSPLYVDGVPLNALNGGLAVNHPQVASQKESSDQRFFSTPTRPNGDPTRDVFEVTLAAPQRINRVQFSLAHFPQRAWVQYLDPVTSTWTTMTQANGLTAMVTIQDSIPQVISSGVSDNTHIHPQHFGQGHWTPYDFKVAPFTSSKLRIVMTRLAAESVPVSTLGTAVDYSLGVKDFIVGYVVASAMDIPNTTRSSDTLTEREPIASSTDLLGSTVDYVLRENRASDLLANTGAIWKSGPQPMADAVVCLYVDARDPQGNPQVVDRFFLDPLKTGSTVNLYYSLDVPQPDVFPASETPMSFPLTRPYGATVPTPTDTGILFPPTTSFLDIDNTAVQFDPTQPFQIHAEFQPQFPSTSTTEAVFYDDGVLSVGWYPDATGATSNAYFQARLGSMVTAFIGIPFAFNARLTATITFDGDTLTLAGPLGTAESMSGGIVPGTNPPQTLRFGGSLTANAEDAVPGNFRLCAFMIKQGNPDNADAMAAFWADPAAYTASPEYPSQGPLTTDNALLRYVPSQQTSGLDSVNPYGILGGPGVVYELLTWTPVARDYALRKGFLDFNPTKARFFKFEFSNLVAEPFETDYPVVLTANIFPGSQEAPTTAAKAAAQSSNDGGSGMAVNTAVAAVNRFSDQTRLTASGAGAVTPTSSTTYLPTEAMRVIDPQGAARMQDAAPYWNFDKFQSKTTMPRFTSTVQHYYETVSVLMTKRVAYFVGLKAIQMFRMNRQTADDTDQYVELFHDDHDLVYDPAIANWSLSDGKIITLPSLAAPVTLTSQPYNTFRTVQAVQFATTQSPPQQLLTDPDFDDTSLQYWQPTGDATLVPDPFFNANIGSLVRVTRGGSPVTWSSMENSYATWNLIEDSDPNPYLPTWDELENQTSPAASGGLQSYETISPSKIGKLYAAARVLAPTTLEAPLNLRLVNGDGFVLAEKPISVLANQITEWFVEYDIGTGAPPAGAVTWASQSGSMTWDQMAMMGTWNDVTQVTDTLDVFDVRVQLTQDIATSDVWYVDNISIFNEAIMWEFSRDGGNTWWPVWDIRNDPNGVFMFPDGDQSVPGGGSHFLWRVTGAAPNLSVSALQVRFWFDSLMMGIPFNRTVQHGGPNLSPLDQYPYVADDPMFKAWHNVIPQDWWHIYREWVRQHAATPTITQRSFLPNTLPVGVDEGSPAAPARNVMPVSIVYPE